MSKLGLFSGALGALACVAVQAAPNMLIDLTSADFALQGDGSLVPQWVNHGTLGGAFMPVESGAGTTYAVVGGVPAVSFAGNGSSVMTNMVSPNAVCGTGPWSFEVWVYNPELNAGAEVVLTWTARNRWPGTGADGSTVEFRYGWDAGCAVEHCGGNYNLPWNGAVPDAGQWHHVAVTRDSSGVERLYLNGVERVAWHRGINLRDDVGFFTLGATPNMDNLNDWQLPFSGALARVRVYDDGLTHDEVFLNYQADLATFLMPPPIAKYWRGTPGAAAAWGTDANWLGGAAPVDGDLVFIANGGTAAGFAGVDNVFANFQGYDGGLGMAGGSISVPETVSMGWGAGCAFDFNLEGGKFEVTGWDSHHLLLGRDGGQATTVVGGAQGPAWICLDKDIIIGSGAGSLSHMTVWTNGLATVSNGWLYVVANANGGATGTLVMNGGEVRGERSNNLVLGNGTGAHSTLILNDGVVGPFNEVWMSDNYADASNLAEAYLNGGLLWIRRFAPRTGGNNYVYLNGGVIRNRDGRGDFMHDLTAAYVQAGGAHFDVIAGTAIEVYQPLLEDPSSMGGGLVKTGPGRLSLRGANTFMGDITVTAGTLLLGNADALPPGYSGTILLDGGGIGWDTAGGAAALLARLDPNSVGALILFGVDAAEDIDLSGHPGVSLGTSGNVDYSGTWTPGGNHYAFYLADGVIYYRQPITGSARVTLEAGSSGFLDFYGDSSYTGGTTINGCTLVIYHVNALGQQAAPGVKDIGIYGGALMINVTHDNTQLFNLLNRIKQDSYGALLVGEPVNNLHFDLSGLPGLALGGDNNNQRDFNGTLLPHSTTGYHLGGGRNDLWNHGLAFSNLDLPCRVLIDLPGGVMLSHNNTFTGGITVTNRAMLWARNDGSLGAVPPAPVADYLYISGGTFRPETDALPMLVHTNRGLTVGADGATFFPPGNRYAAWLGDLSGSGPVTSTDNGVMIFGGTDNTWDGVLTMTSNNDDGTFAVGYGDAFSWPRNNVIQGNGMFGVATDLDILWSDMFAHPLGNVPPQYDAPDGTGAILGLRKLGAGTLTLDVASTYRRNTRVESGTLKVAAENAIPWGRDRGNLDFRNGNFFPRGTLDLNGHDVNVNGILGAGIITNAQEGARTLTFGHENRTETFIGAIDAGVKAVKVGGGTQTLQTGSRVDDLTVQQGTVAAGPGVPFGSVALGGGGAAFRAGLSADNVYGLTGEYYWFDHTGLWQLVLENRMNIDLETFEAFFAQYVPWTILSSAGFGEGFDTGPEGERFDTAGYRNLNNFYACWTGEFYAEAAGEYVFATASDDGSVVYIDRQLVVDNDRDQGYNLGDQRSGAIELAEGWHDIVIGFYQKGGGRALTVLMTPPGGEQDVLPQALLRPYPVTVGTLAAGPGSRVEILGNTAVILAGDTVNVCSGKLVSASAEARFVKDGNADFVFAWNNVPEYRGQLIMNGGNLELWGAAASLTPVHFAQEGVLVALPEREDLPNLGLKGTYHNYNYHGTSFENLDNEFNPLTPEYVAYTTQTGATASATALYFDYSEGSLFPAQYAAYPGFEATEFRTRFQGKFLALEPGNYTIGLSTDDRGDMFLNGQQIITGVNWNSGIVRTNIYLNAGTHDLQIAHGQGGGGYRVSAYVTPPGGAETSMPNALLRPSVSTVGGVSGNGRLSLPSAGSYLRLQIDTAQELSQSVTGAVGSEIEKNGTETLTLVADNDAFGGTWYVLGGTLVAGDGGAAGTLGGARVYVAAGARLVFDRADDIAYAGEISGCGEVCSIGGGRVIISNVGSDFSGTFTSGDFVFTGEGADVLATSLAQGQGLDPLTAHFEDGARLLIPPPTGSPLDLPPLVFSNGTLALSLVDNSAYYIETLLVAAGGTASISISKPSGLIGRYYELTDNPDPNHIRDAGYFNTIADGEQFLGGYPFICAASSWDAGPDFCFGSTEQNNLKFPSPVQTRWEYLGAIWKGQIVIPATGDYTFMTHSDDNSMLFIDGNLVVNNNGSHGMDYRYGDTFLTAGRHDIAILFAQGNGGWGLNVGFGFGTQDVAEIVPLPNNMLIADPADYALVSNIGSLPNVLSMDADAAFSLEVGTLGVVEGPGTGTLDITSGGALPNGTLLLNDLYVESPGAVLATTGNTLIKGANLHVTIGREPPKGTLTKIGDFTSATYGLPLMGRTMSLGGSEKGRLVYRNGKLYISTSNGTLLILR